MPISYPVLRILLAYGGSLLCLAAGIYYTGRLSFTWEPIPFIILILILTVREIFALLHSHKITERILLAGCTLLVILLPFGDLFIYLAAPLALYTIIIYGKNIYTHLQLHSPLAWGWAALVAVGFIGGIGSLSPSSAWLMSAALAGFSLLFLLGRVFSLPAKGALFLSELFTGILPLTLCFVFFHLYLGQSISLMGIQFSANRYAASFLSNWAANGAGFLVIAFTLVFIRFLRVVRESNAADIAFTGISLIFIFIGAISTQTRMIFFFFSGFGLVFLIFYPWNFLRRFRFFLIMLPLGLIPLLAHFSEKWRETLVNPLAQNSFIDRALQLSTGWDLWKDNFWQGIGLFNFRLYYSPIAKAQNLPEVEFLHNIYASMAVETGIIGLILFLGVIFLLMRDYIRSRKQALPYGGMLLLGGAALHNCTDNWLYVLKFSVLLFFLLGFFYPKNPSKD